MHSLYPDVENHNTTTGRRSLPCPAASARLEGPGSRSRPVALVAIGALSSYRTVPHHRPGNSRRRTAYTAQQRQTSPSRRSVTDARASRVAIKPVVVEDRVVRIHTALPPGGHLDIHGSIAALTTGCSPAPSHSRARSPLGAVPDTRPGRWSKI